MARKFTPEVQAVVLEALRDNPSAASKAGIGSTTLYNWLHEGEQGNPEFEAFALEAQHARMCMKDEIVASLFKIATDEMHPQATKAAHQLLTNLYPAEFANVKHTVTHRADEPPELDVSKLPTAELRSFLKTLKRLQADADGTPPQQAITVIEAVETGAEVEKKMLRNPDAN